jgi:hypothetical protein
MDSIWKRWKFCRRRRPTTSKQTILVSGPTMDIFNFQAWFSYLTVRAPKGARSEILRKALYIGGNVKFEV